VLFRAIVSVAAFAAATAATPAALPLWFPLALAAMWIAVTTILGFLAGHVALLARFPPVDERTGERFRSASGSLRWVSFHHALHVGVGARGLHLGPSWLFRPVFHRGIPCIPWSELRLLRSQSDGKLARLAGSRLEVRSMGLRFTVGGAAGRAIERRLAAPGAAAASAPGRLVRER
jgi:hypothetical protein